MSAPHTPRSGQPGAGDDSAPGLLYSAELVRRVEREARDATRLPWWFWEAGAVIFVVAVVASSVWPWGVAS